MKWFLIILLLIGGSASVSAQLELIPVEGGSSGIGGFLIERNPFFFGNAFVGEISVNIWYPVDGGTYATNQRWLNTTLSGGVEPYSCQYRTYGGWNSYYCDGSECYQYITFPYGNIDITVYCTDDRGSSGQDQISVTILGYSLGGIVQEDLSLMALPILISTFIVIAGRRRKKDHSPNE